MKKYIQHKDLRKIFDISPDYFKARMYKELIEGIHFIIPPTNSRTKKIILWNIEELDKWLRSNKSSNKDEIDALLKRKR